MSIRKPMVAGAVMLLVLAAVVGCRTLRDLGRPYHEPVATAAP